MLFWFSNRVLVDGRQGRCDPMFRRTRNVIYGRSGPDVFPNNDRQRGQQFSNPTEAAAGGVADLDRDSSRSLFVGPFNSVEPTCLRRPGVWNADDNRAVYAFTCDGEVHCMNLMRFYKYIWENQNMENAKRNA